MLAAVALALAGCAALYLTRGEGGGPSPTPTPSELEGVTPISVDPPAIPMTPKPGKRAGGRARVSNLGSDELHVRAWVEGVDGSVNPSAFSLRGGEAKEVTVETVLPPRGELSSGKYFLVLDWGSGQLKVPLLYPEPGHATPGGVGGQAGWEAGGTTEGPGAEASGEAGSAPGTLWLEIDLRLKVIGSGSSTTTAGEVTTAVSGEVLREEVLVLRVNLTRVAGRTYQGVGTLELRRIYVTATNKGIMTSPETQCNSTIAYEYSGDGSWDVLVYVMLDERGRIVEIDVNSLPNSTNPVPASIEIPGSSVTTCVSHGRAVTTSGESSKLIGAYFEEHIESLVDWVGPLEPGTHEFSDYYEVSWQGLEELLKCMPEDRSFTLGGIVTLALASP